MLDILTQLQCISPCLDQTTIRQMSRVIGAMLAMTGRVTMLGISRWTETGGSYRKVQRYFHTIIPWGQVFWLFFRHHLYQPQAQYILAGDESVVTKAGKATHGLDRFFSSLYGKPVPGLAFFALSLININQRQSYPIWVEQVIRSPEEKAQAKLKAKQKRTKKSGKPGRPKGSKNRDKTQVSLNPELAQIQQMLNKLLDLITGTLPIKYVVMDGKFGHNNALQMIRQSGLHLVSKLRCDAALYFRYQGPYAGRGAPRQYGDKADYAHLPTQYLRQTTVENHIQTDIYQAQMRHRDFAQLLNVVIVLKTNLKTGVRAHVILFSSDLTLTFAQIIDFYSLRFQIEFNFRDAKQFWGLEDFMTIKETAVTHSANLALFMVNLSHLLLAQFHQAHPDAHLLDLKAHFRAHKYVTETLKWLPDLPEPISFDAIFSKVSALGKIHFPSLTSQSS